MPVRAKATHSTPRRRTVAVAHRPHGRVTPTHRPVKHRPVRVEVKPHSPSPYTKALRFLATLSDYERLRIVRYNSQNFDLDRMRSLLKRIGNPHDHFRSVHIAGTKGKGSTCAMIASMLKSAGYKVGLYTSPHLLDIRER